MNKKFMLLGIALLSTFALQADEQEQTATTEQTTQDPTVAVETTAKEKDKDKDCGCKH